jgi:hypothetical protein
VLEVDTSRPVDVAGVAAWIARQPEWGLPVPGRRTRPSGDQAAQALQRGHVIPGAFDEALLGTVRFLWWERRGHQGAGQPIVQPR